MPAAKGQKGVRAELKKFAEGDLHSGSRTGPVVTNRKQAIAIALHAAGVARDQQKPQRKARNRR